ncbi:hypothetical protein [Bacillus sp. N35-10-4]|uniref:hypothetical protein n=1 Tax=Bacillus sp. N35-10-4 TaxID=1866315 RepID=UPI001587519D|nr:hypothetical protein [Bacillus sp. N35-10-4]
MSKQDLLVRMSIDPVWSPDIKDGLFQQMVDLMGEKDLIDVNLPALRAERRGRWLQILSQLKPIFKYTFLSFEEDEIFINSEIFQGFLSSEFLWDTNFSLPHPLGYGLGIEKATAFIHFLRTNTKFPVELLELAELEYAVFKAGYLPPNKQSSITTEKLYHAQAASFMAVKHDVLKILEGKETVAPIDNTYYVISPIGKTFRVTEDVFRFLNSFATGRIAGTNKWEESILAMALSIRILCRNQNELDKYTV